MGKVLAVVSILVGVLVACYGIFGLFFTMMSPDYDGTFPWGALAPFLGSIPFLLLGWWVWRGEEH
jgi:hypothetical protein